ncbi:non-specific lipid-transfer protein A-like [Cicer arietinum]|uniref:Non-specific lipid-transfer protein A-like n=1 Tax=Cicer arietinum TaxID=3827 RepID=A0A1S2Z1Q0_CICAR|nr:non-specific lipid-transfer protein A-like [Cicer arietinum]
MGKKIIAFLMLVMVLGMQVRTLDAHQIDDISCFEAIISLVSCAPFLTGVGQPAPSTTCCEGAHNLFQKADTTQVRRDICQCLKGASIKFGVNSDKAKQLPQLCNIGLSFSFDPSIDCNTIP